MYVDTSIILAIFPSPCSESQWARVFNEGWSGGGGGLMDRLGGRGERYPEEGCRRMGSGGQG